MRTTGYIKATSAILSAMMLCSCASTTKISSSPSGATLFINGEKVGKTPYSYTDSKIITSTVNVKISQPGYQDFVTSFQRNEEVDTGPLIGGILTGIPLLWCMKYKPEHNYELVSTGSGTATDGVDSKSSYEQPVSSSSNASSVKKSKKKMR